MKKMICMAAALLMVFLCAGGALADQTVYLPGSAYRLALPDEMRYDGPGNKDEGDDAAFAYVHEAISLEIDFFWLDNKAGLTLETLAEILKLAEQEPERKILAEGLKLDGEPELVTISGIRMIVLRIVDPTDGAKCIDYILTDGDKIQQICFWYGTKEAAAMTETIIRSITNKD